MNTQAELDIRLPTIAELGHDLLMTTTRQRWITLSRPLWGVIAYVIAAYLHLWWITPIILFLTFIAVVTATHDVVHGTLGLSKTQTEWALFFMGLVLLESGHAYYATHQQHHNTFPSSDDPEGYPAELSLLGALGYGPIFLWRLWWWAYQHNPSKHAWLIIEIAAPIIAIILGIQTRANSPAILIYVVMAIVGSWVYPLLTVYLPHKDYGDTPLTQTHTLRGRIIPAIFLELTYHLEHHLYPQVPSHNLPELSRRLDPVFKRAGVEFWYVP